VTVATVSAPFVTRYTPAASMAVMTTDGGKRSGHWTIPFVFNQPVVSARMSITVPRSPCSARRIVTPAGSCVGTGANKRNAVMTAIDESGEGVLTYRNRGQHFRRDHPDGIEVVVAPVDYLPADSALLIIGMSSWWLHSYFLQGGSTAGS
jgi:hypothetical protein